MNVRQLQMRSCHPSLDINKDMSGYVEQLLKEDIPAVIILKEERQEEPLWGRRKRYGFFGSEESIQIGSVPKKRISLTIEYDEPRHIANAYHDFQRINQITSLDYYDPEIILDRMNFLTGRWTLSSRFDPSKKITGPQPSDSMNAVVTLWGLVDSVEMRQALISLADKLYEPIKTRRHYYTTTYDGGSCSGYPPQLKLSKSWEGFDEIKLSDFFQKVQELSEYYHLREKWFHGYSPQRIVFPNNNCLLYRIDLLKKTYQTEKPVQVKYTDPDYPMLVVKATIWRNSTHENGARCFFMITHEAKMTAYR